MKTRSLIPDYLAFLKGVVDTEDLPLNISRETLQENIVLRKISQTISKQILSHLEKMAKDEEVHRQGAFLEGKVLSDAGDRGDRAAPEQGCAVLQGPGHDAGPITGLAVCLNQVVEQMGGAAAPAAEAEAPAAE